MSKAQTDHFPTGLRGLALRNLDKIRFAPTETSIYSIPKWKEQEVLGGFVGKITRPPSQAIPTEQWTKSISLFEAELIGSQQSYTVPFGVWKISIIVLPLAFFIPIQSQTFLFASPSISHDLASWKVTTHSKLLGKFAIKVFGKCFRMAVQEAHRDAKQPSLFNPLSDNLNATQPQKIVSPYGDLYDLLYPPPSEIADESIPKFTDLRDYQKDGVHFLVQRDHALLADDMGLGKTAQCSIALAILRKSERVGTALIICPRAVISQWKDEAKRWGDLHVRIVEGTPEQRRLIWVHNTGVLLVTPHVVERDRDWIEDKKFDLVVCDDVSMLKNPNAKITRAIRAIPRQRSWCLNGTPLENRPEDFVNVMEFVCSGLFKPQEREYAPASQIVKKRVVPYFLRRTKQKYLVECNELKPKIVAEPISLEMSSEQWQTYRALEQREWEAFQKEGVKTNKVHIFAVLLRLVQTCNFDRDTGRSAKADYLMRQLSDTLTDKQPEVKAIVFSRFVETLQHLEKSLLRFKPIIYHGGLSDNQRDAVLHQFRTEGRLLLMSTKSGARGLNLQEANHVFHFDRTWNPVDALQGEDRCWRFGQKREVFVSRYTQKGTIEERIDANLRRKLGLIDEYVESIADDPDSDIEQIISERWSMDELIELLRPSRPH